MTLFEGQPSALLNYLVSQLTAVRSQAQTMMGLCGLIITVTGFSGPRMVTAASFSAIAMVMGIALTLIAAIICLNVMTAIRWVSQELEDDLVATIVRVIERRDTQLRRTTIAGAFVAGGLTCYLAAVAAAAFVGNG